MQIRKADLGTPDLEARTVPVVLTTDYPVQRGDFIEVLDVSLVDLSRGDLPLIESHDHNQLNIGVVRNIRPAGARLLGLAVFGTSARASEVLADVQAGIVTGCSIGYQLTDEGVPVTLPDGRPARRFGFMPFEVSAVAIPADPRAGFNKRSHTLSLNKPPKAPIMETTAIETRNHAAEIAAIAKATTGAGIDAVAMRAIQEGKTVEEFQQELIRHMSNKPLATSDAANSPHQLEHRDIGTAVMLRSAEDFKRHYSTRPSFGEAVGLADFMRGVAGMRTTSAATRALSVGLDSAGGFAVPAAVMPDILQALAPASSVMAAGAAIVPLGDDAKSYSFAAVQNLPVASWRAENGAVAESDPTFRNVLMTPRSLSFVIRVSRELLADGRNMGAALQQAIAQAFAVEIDRACLRGSGTAPEVRGLLNTAGVQAVGNGTNGAVLAGYANLFSGVQAILQANGPMPTAAIMSPRSLVRLGSLADSTGQPLQVPAMLQPVRQLQTSQIPNNLTVGSSSDCSEIYIGDFANFAVGMREALSVQMLQETYAANGQIGFMCHARLDVAPLYPTAFAIVTGVR